MNPQLAALFAQAQTSVARVCANSLQTARTPPVPQVPPILAPVAAGPAAGLPRFPHRPLHRDNVRSPSGADGRPLTDQVR